jgi:hypothetical protein
MDLHLPRPGPVPRHDLERVRIQNRPAFRKRGVDLFVIEMNHFRWLWRVSRENSQECGCGKQRAEGRGFHALFFTIRLEAKEEYSKHPRTNIQHPGNIQIPSFKGDRSMANKKCSILIAQRCRL